MADPAWLQGVRDRGRWLALPLGGLLALAFAPVDCYVLAFTCPAALYVLWHGVSPREAAWRGFLFTAGTFAAGTYWLFHSIHLVGQAPAWIALLLMFGMVAVMGAYTAAIAVVAVRWAPARGVLRWLLLLPALWVLTEWARGWFLSGFPWLALGYSQLATPLRGYAPVLGVYGVSLAASVTAGVFVTLLLGRARERIVAVAILLALWGTGIALARMEWTMQRGAPLQVALVQGAVPQSLKWEANHRAHTMELYADMTRAHLDRDVIVWPESAIPALEENVRPYLHEMVELANQRGSSLLMGQLRRDAARDSYYNSIAAWAPGRPAQWYDKRRLVPFGEFFPVPRMVRDWLRLMNLPYSDFEPGRDDPLPLQAAGESFAPTICYEDAYGSEQLALVRQSTLLVNVTNDAWFGDSTAPHQHLDISRMRSLESGRAMLRATNDGVTALIEHDGSLIGTLPQFQPAVLTGAVQPRTGLTPYVRFGNGPVLAVLWFAVACMMVLYRRRPQR